MKITIPDELKNLDVNLSKKEFDEKIIDILYLDIINIIKNNNIEFEDTIKLNGKYIFDLIKELK